MFLLPGAERYRRVLLTGGAVGLLLLQAILRLPPIESWTQRVLGPVQRPITGLAGSLADLLQADPSAASTADAPPTTSVLVQTERRLGMPASVPGMAWLEVPVRSLEPDRGHMLLAAGRDFHLAKGQVVAFGDTFLGRLGEVREHEAEVELWSSAGMRTGLSMQLPDHAPIQAVCFGRGRAGPAVVDWAEDETLFAADLPLSWRPRPLDPPTLLAAGLQLGSLRMEGQESRGTVHWVVHQGIPVAAEGRVFVAAGAVGTRLIAEPSQRRAAANRLLQTDAILGPGWFAFSAAGEFRPTVVTDRGKVCGEVLSWRGNWGWARQQPPARWQQRAVALDLAVGEVLAAESWSQEERVLPLFTRGGQDLPRGLWLGYRDESAPVPGESLQALRLDSEPLDELP